MHIPEEERECYPKKFNKRKGWRGGKPTFNKLMGKTNLWRKHMKGRFSFTITAI